MAEKSLSENRNDTHEAELYYDASFWDETAQHIWVQDLFAWTNVAKAIQRPVC